MLDLDTGRFTLLCTDVANDFLRIFFHLDNTYYSGISTAKKYYLTGEKWRGHFHIICPTQIQVCIYMCEQLRWQAPLEIQLI